MRIKAPRPGPAARRHTKATQPSPDNLGDKPISNRRPITVIDASEAGAVDADRPAIIIEGIGYVAVDLRPVEATDVLQGCFPCVETPEVLDLRRGGRGGQPLGAELELFWFEI